MPSWVSVSTSCLILIGVERGIMRKIGENWEKLCNCLLELATVLRQIWGNDHLICSFGLGQPHLALEWKSGQGKARFHWGAVTVTFRVNFSPLEAQKSIYIDFIASNGGITTFFSKSVYILPYFLFYGFLTYDLLIHTVIFYSACPFIFLPLLSLPSSIFLFGATFILFHVSCYFSCFYTPRENQLYFCMAQFVHLYFHKHIAPQ